MIAIIAYMLMIDAAMAQTVVVEEPGFMGTIQGWIMTTLGGIVTLIIGWLATWAQSNFKVNIEQKWRDALHSAIMSGIMLGLKQVGFANKAMAAGAAMPVGVGTGMVQPVPKPLTTGEQDIVVSVAVDYAKNSVKDAIKGLLPMDGTGILAQMAKSKLEGILGGVLGAAVAGGMNSSGTGMGGPTNR